MMWGCVVVSLIHMQLSRVPNITCWRDFFSIVYSYFGLLKKKIKLFSYCWVLRLLCIFWIIVLYHTCLLQIFSPSMWHVFSFSWQCFTQSKIFNFNEDQLVSSFFHELCFSGYLLALKIKSYFINKKIVYLGIVGELQFEIRKL